MRLSTGATGRVFQRKFKKDRCSSKGGFFDFQSPQPVASFCNKLIPFLKYLLLKRYHFFSRNEVERGSQMISEENRMKPLTSPH